jgi:AcrR family transcriptional regulator
MTNDARAVRGAETRLRILDATRAELAHEGLDLTLDGVAARLSMTKQAVLYHFPSKDRLLVELSLEGILEESDAMVTAVEPASSAADAVRRFVRANVAFHLADLARFRLIYVRAGVVRGAKASLSISEREERLYPVTSRMYDALEVKLRTHRRLPSDTDPRTLAVGIHLSSLGYATMASHLAGAQEKMKRSFAEYADAAATILAHGLGEDEEKKRARPRVRRSRA